MDKYKMTTKKLKTLHLVKLNLCYFVELSDIGNVCLVFQKPQNGSINRTFFQSSNSYGF